MQHLHLPLAFASGILCAGSPLLAQSRSHHGAASGIDLVSRYACSDNLNAATNVFGRALPAGPAMDTEKLAKLAESMREPRHGAPTPGNLDRVPVGIVFLGQFIDHDVTLDILTQLGELSDPRLIENFRTPTLDLDSVYLDGPSASPHLYDQERQGFFAIGNRVNEMDLPRNDQGVALIGDPRNDENGAISQLHLLFLRFHNAVMTEIARGRLDDFRFVGESDFELARRLVTWHYQWIVLGEFLPAVVEPGTLDQVKQMGATSQHDGWCNGAPFLPIEFSAAAFRFGHSQVLDSYTTSAGRNGVELFAPPARSLTSFEAVPVENVIDWSFFFSVDRSRPQLARPLDAKLAVELFDLPFESGDRNERSLAFRNLERGTNTFRLATGEQAAEFFQVPKSRRIPTPEAVKDAGLTETPLWFYSLAEAEQNGGRLGPVGGRIVAGTLIGLLRDDPHSVLNSLWTKAGREQPYRIGTKRGEDASRTGASTRPKGQMDWVPPLGRNTTDFSSPRDRYKAGPLFTMSDLIEFTLRVERN